MSVTICMIGLIIAILCAWNAFLQEVADRAEYKRRLKAQEEKIHSFELSYDEQNNVSDITVA